MHDFQGYFSRTFQERSNFPALSRTKMIFQDFSVLFQNVQWALSYALIIISQADQLVMPTVEHEPA